MRNLWNPVRNLWIYETLCVSGTGRIQLLQPLFTWFFLYFMLSLRDFSIIKLFPSCPESPSLYSILSSSHVTTALFTFCTYFPCFSRNPFFSVTRCVFQSKFPVWDTHFLPDWVFVHPYFHQSNSFRLVGCVLSHCIKHLHGMCLPRPVARTSLTRLWQVSQSLQGRGGWMLKFWMRPRKIPI